MIVLIGGEKGGAGKSTLATNLAAYLATLKRQGVKDARVDHLPNGNIVCRWETDSWMASATISAELQIIRLIACKEQK